MQLIPIGTTTAVPAPAWQCWPSGAQGPGWAISQVTVLAGGGRTRLATRPGHGGLPAGACRCRRAGHPQPVPRRRQGRLAFKRPVLRATGIPLQMLGNLAGPGRKLPTMWWRYQRHSGCSRAASHLHAMFGAPTLR